MARFPISQDEVLALAEAITAGLNSNTVVYPAPPVPAAELQAELAVCKGALDDVVATRAAYEEAVTAKDQSLAGLAQKMKTNLRYAENVVSYNDDKLKLLGWSGKRAIRSLTAPGQVGSLKTIEQGFDRLTLEWKKPASGGKAAAYKIQRCVKDSGQWSDIATSLSTKAELIDQPRLTDMEYRVIAINKAGQSPPSNTVTVVL
jgi:hypothetical protein